MKSDTTLYAIANGKLVCLHPDNKAAQWETSVVYEKHRVQALVVHPRNKNLLLMGTQHESLLLSRDAGKTWEPPDFPASNVFSVSISPADGSFYAGCEPSALYKSTDEGKTWIALDSLLEAPSAKHWSFPPRPNTSHVRWIAPNPVSAELLVIGIEAGALLVSFDGGKTWADRPPGASHDTHHLAWDMKDPQRIYQAAGDSPKLSNDGGLTWQTAPGKIPKKYTFGMAASQDEPGTWFISASPSAFAAHRSSQANATIYRWRHNGPWEPLTNGLPENLSSLPWCMLALKGYMLVGTHAGALYQSTDQGESWKKIAIDDGVFANLESLIAFNGSPGPVVLVTD